jgi:3'-phosphoadenosine 5'-phosphosulfate sulfotransferase (PAPS reductase)/FAD synthetase
MSNLQRRVEHSLDLIQNVLDHYKSPAVLSSFGKDSMVLLHLVRRLHRRLPVLVMEMPQFRHKWAFGQHIAALWDLDIHTPPLANVALQSSEHGIEAVWQYEIGPGQLMGFQRQTLPPEEGRRWLCGLRDIIQAPKGAPSFFKWDALLSGQRSVDTTRKYGAMPLAVDSLNHSGRAADLHFVLRDWTDEQIWDYTAQEDILINEDRYEPTGKGNLFQEKADKWNSNDWVHACTACIDCRGPEVVRCPLLDSEMNNISSQMPYIDFQPDYFARETTTDPA